MQAAEAEKEKKFRRIVRLAIEFCVELKDCDFLFKDLCWLFQDVSVSSMELLFVKELEPYILSGKFQEWELPHEVIESFLHTYYMREGSAESFEKIIVNLNLSQCPKTTILSFVKYCEQNYLTTGIIFLYTELFERKDVSDYM